MEWRRLLLLHGTGIVAQLLLFVSLRTPLLSIDRGFLGFTCNQLHQLRHDGPAPVKPLQTLPKKGGDPQKTVITYLITREEYLIQFNVSLPLLKRNWLLRYPVSALIVFHTSDIRAENIRSIADHWNADIRTVSISPTLPDYVHQLQKTDACVCCCNNHRGPGRKGPGGMVVGQYHKNYCQMNRFRTFEMYRHPSLADFDYFIQMDTDLYVKKPMPYNPVVRMADLGGVMGYHKKEVRPNTKSDCNLGMYEAIENWINRSSLYPRYRPARGTSYTGNFIIGDLRFFRSEEYYTFARWINNEEKGIWTHRWPDQAFLPIIAGVYFAEAQHVQFSDLLTEEVLVHTSQSIGRKP